MVCRRSRCTLGRATLVANRVGRPDVAITRKTKMLTYLWSSLQGVLLVALRGDVGLDDFISFFRRAAQKFPPHVVVEQEGLQPLWSPVDVVA